MARGLDAGSWYRAYLVFLLATIFALNGLDGTALGLVLPNIKSALHLTDTQLGVLTGIAFSLFYATVGIPIGRWADRGDRVAIIALTAALWGVMVMLVGAARSFWQLLLIRIGVAVGEAGCVPAAYSLIAQYFEREERPRAIAKYLLGGYVAVVLGYPAAGWLSHYFGWRTMFVCIGLPSVVVAPIAWWTLSEPRRSPRMAVGAAISTEQSPRMLKVIRVLWVNRTFRYLLAVICANTLFGGGINIWQPSFFARSYGWKVQQLGLYFSAVYGVGGIIGTYAGGYLASRFAPKNERLQLGTFALFSAGFGGVSALIYLSRNSTVSVTLLGLAVICVCLQNGPIFAATQTVVPERMRAISISVIYLFSNLLGAGVGPLLVGALSDALHRFAGAESLRYALLAMCPGYILAAWLLWQAARTVSGDAEGATLETREAPRLRESGT